MDYGQLLSNFAATAANTYGNLRANVAPTPTPAPSSTTAPAWQKFLPLGIGAVVLLVVIALVMRSGK